MAATIKAYVYTGTNAATESTLAVPDMTPAGISFLSIDSDANDTTTRQNNPVLAGTSSFAKHIRLKATVAPSVSWGNTKVWTATGAQANVGLRFKVVGTGGATPGTGDSTETGATLTGDDSLYSYTTQGGAATWDTATYSAQNTVSKALLLQLQPTGAATPGAWTTTTISYSYDEI